MHIDLDNLHNNITGINNTIEHLEMIDLEMNKSSIRIGNDIVRLRDDVGNNIVSLQNADTDMHIDLGKVYKQ